MKLTKWTPDSSKKPRVESIAFTINGNTNCTYSRRNMSNGSVFEVFRSNNEFLKILKDKFGKILGHKTNVPIPLGDVQRVYNRSSELVRSRVNSLLYTPVAFRAYK